MTDAEIMKAKEHYKYGITHDIFKEPVTSYAKTALWAFEEINRQKAEIEKLEHQLETLCLTLKLAKSEAIKEFAERLCDGRVSNDPVVIAVKTELQSTMSQVK